MSMFTKATKRAVKARVALDGPTGAGKTWTGLMWATTLGEKVAVIDTERGSASLYSDRYDFDVLEMTPPYDPARLIEALESADKAGYDVVLIDSLSHFWEGEGGTLDIVDAAGQRSGGNNFAGWKVGTPALRHLVDTMLGLDAHLIVTMRSKMEWVLDENERGKKVPRRVGMAPVMRAGIEYEFQLVGDLDLEHRLTITKSRSELLADQVYPAGRSKEGAETFKGWLEAGEPTASRNDVDSLVARMNKLDGDERKACKQGFADRFGRPVGLLASKLEEASAFVATFESLQTAEPEPVATCSVDGCTIEGLHKHDTFVEKTRTPAPVVAAPPPAPVDEAPPSTGVRSAPPESGTVSKTWVRNLVDVCTDLGLNRDARLALIAHAIGREVESSTHVLMGEAGAVREWVAKLKDGTHRMGHEPGGPWLVVAKESEPAYAPGGEPWA